MKINVNGIEMYYEKYGQGRPLVMVHGNSVDHNEFKGSFSKLRNYFTVYAIDSRDHGQSSKVSELHYSDMADDIVAFMDQLDLKDVVFFGHSDGAIIGLLAAMRTDRIGKLLAGSGNMSPEGAAAWIRVLNKAMYAATKNQKFLMMDTEPNITTADLATIKVPTVVIAGSRDIIKREETQRIAGSIPGAKLRILKGHGHISYINSKNVLADLIIEEAT